LAGLLALLTKGIEMVNVKRYEKDVIYIEGEYYSEAEAIQLAAEILVACNVPLVKSLDRQNFVKWNTESSFFEAYERALFGD
jgi:hypothetical protein